MNWNWDPRTWKTATRLLLGVVTIWPVIYISLFVGVVFSGILFGVLSHREPNHADVDLIQHVLPIGFMLLFVMHLLTMLLIMMLLPLYIVLATQDQRHDQNARIIWIVLFATLGILANPVYWYLYIWRKPKPPAEPLFTPS